MAAKISIYLPRLFLAMFPLLVGLVTEASAETVVVTDSRNPVPASAGVRVIYLDAPDLLQKQLSVGLPKDPRLAAVEVQRRMSGERGREINQQLREAHQGVADAWSWGVKKIPAVVVDRQYVVYGNTDVSRAESLVSVYRSQGRP